MEIRLVSPTRGYQKSFIYLDNNLTIQHFEHIAQAQSNTRVWNKYLFAKCTFEILFGAQNGKNIESI